MTNTSKSHKRCPACGSSNPIDAWECEMCGTSFSNVKPPRSVQQADVKPQTSAAAPATAPATQPKPAATKPPPAAPASTSTAQTPAAKPQPKTTNGKSATKPAANTAAASKAATAATDSFNTPIKNAGSMKKPAPLYASKPRFGLGSLAALVFVAAFGIAAIVFGINALQSNTPAAPVQPIAVTLDATATLLPLPTETSVAPAVMPAATDAPTLAPTALPTEAPTDAAALLPTIAPATTAIVEATIAPSPTTAQKPSATPVATATPAATSAPIGSGETVSYTVKGGDTCGAIAKQLGVTVAQIVEQNKLDSRCFLNVGKVLTITK